MISILKRYSEIYRKYDLELYQDDKPFYKFICKIYLIDGSVLFVRDYKFLTHRKYAYQWMKKGGELIVRWDNAPHYSKLKTAPNHKHLGKDGKVAESHESTLEEVLKYIKVKIAK